MKTYKWIVALVLVSLVALAAAGCTPTPTAAPTAAPTEAPTEEPTEAPATEEPEETVTIVVGMNAEYPPFESVDEDGNIVGFDIDLLDALAAAGGFEYELVNTRWDGIFFALAAGEFDVVCSAASIYPDRLEIVDFTDPYFDSGQAIAVRADNTDINSPDDLAGKSVGVQSGTTGDIWLTDDTEAEVARYDENTMAFQALANGDVDAAVADNMVVYEIVRANPEMDLKVVPGVWSAEQYGIAVIKDKPEILALLDDALDTIQADGTFDAIFNEWFGTE